jgi:hypothetical protein
MTRSSFRPMTSSQRRSVKRDFAFLTVVDTTRNAQIANIRIPAGVREAMVLEKSGPLLHVDMMDQNKIAVINCKTHQLLHVWPITKPQEYCYRIG